MVITSCPSSENVNQEHDFSDSRFSFISESSEMIGMRVDDYRQSNIKKFAGASCDETGSQIRKQEPCRETSYCVALTVLTNWAGTVP